MVITFRLLKNCAHSVVNLIPEHLILNTYAHLGSRAHNLSGEVIFWMFFYKTSVESLW